MRVLRRSCIAGARDAVGVVVIIDVFRAFSCAPLFFHLGAGKVLLESDPEKALALKRDIPGAILVGEVNEVPIEGADLGNSPSHAIERGRALFEGRPVVHRTTAGVVGVGLVHGQAEEVILGSFVMARAIAKDLLRRNPDTVTLLAMGDRGLTPSPEDEACSAYLEHLLTGSPFDPVEAFRRIVFQKTAQKFLQGTIPYLPREDVVFCLQRDLFDLVLGVERRDGLLLVRDRRHRAP